MTIVDKPSEQSDPESGQLKLSGPLLSLTPGDMDGGSANWGLGSPPSDTSKAKTRAEPTPGAAVYSCGTAAAGDRQKEQGERHDSSSLKSFMDNAMIKRLGFLFLDPCVFCHTITALTLKENLCCCPLSLVLLNPFKVTFCDFGYLYMLPVLSSPLTVVTGGDGIALPQKVLFPAERISLQWNQVHRIGAGLHNLGNTCFLNSALQCLSYTAPLANYMLSREHSKTCTFLE